MQKHRCIKECSPKSQLLLLGDFHITLKTLLPFGCVFPPMNVINKNIDR